MLTINIRGLGLNANNIPLEMFDHSLSVNDVIDGVNVQIDESSEGAVKDILTKALDGRFQMNRIGTGILMFEPVPETTQAEAAPQPIGEPEPSMTQQAEGMATLETPPTMPNTPTTPGTFDEEDFDDEEGDEAEDEDLHGELDAAPENIERASNFNLDNYPRIENEDDVVSAIAAMTNTQAVHRAALVREKNHLFNRRWAELISLRREIDDLSAEVAADPLVATLKEQAELLAGNEQNMIEDVFFSGDNIVVVTKELVTSEPIENAVRKIGRMAFIIKIRSFVGNPESRGLVIIRNMDRQVFVNNEYWECGHVPSAGGPCYGTAWEMLFRAFVSRDLPTVVEVLIRFVTQPNIADGWGRVMTRWPVVEVVETGAE